MATEIDRIVRLIEKSFDKQPWYGDSIMKILKDIQPEIVFEKVEATHSIIELVLHMAAWRTFAINRLSGDDLFQITEETNFPQPATWKDALKTLHQSQIELVSAVKNFPEEKLSEICPSNEHKYTYYTLLHGLTQHDTYHLGQIALLKKAFTK